MIQKCKFQKKMIHQFVSFLFWNLHFWIIFLHKLVDQYGALCLHYVSLLLPVGSSRVCMDGPGNRGSFC